MKRIAIVPSLLFLVLLGACKDDYVGNNPIIPASGGSYIVSVGEDNSISTLDPDGTNRNIVVPADNTYRRVIEAVDGKIFYSEAHTTAQGSEKLISMIDVTRNSITKIVQIKCDPAENPLALPLATVTPDGARVLVLTCGALDLGASGHQDTAHVYVNSVATTQGDFPGVLSHPTTISASYGVEAMTRPVCSIGGSTIAFCYYVGSGNARMVSVNIDGTDLHDFGQVGMGYLTADRQAGPVWSPDGSRLAIVGPEGRTADIYDAAGGKISSIPALPANAAAMRALYWSPRGGEFAAVVDGWGAASSPYREYRIYALGLDGTLTDMVNFNQHGRPDSMGYMDYFCDWSPDGTRMVLLGQANLNGTMQGYDLYVTDAAENRLRLCANIQVRVKDAIWMRSTTPAT